MRRLNVLLSTPHSGATTGSGVQIYLLARELIKRGHACTVVFKKKPGGGGAYDPTLEKFQKIGARVIRVPFAKLKYRFTIPVLMELGDYVYKNPFDVVHSFAGMDLDYFFILSFFAPIGALISNRGTCEPLDVFNSIKYRLPTVNSIVAVSRAVEDVLEKSGGVSRKKILLSYSAIDLEKFDPGLDGGPLRAELKVSCSTPLIGCIGSLRFQPGHLKGGIELLDAARMILQERPDARFLLAGHIKPELFFQEAEARGISDSFILAGFREDVPAVLAACGLTISPSIRSEGLTGVIRESMAMKTPVVATDVGGNGELITDGETGMLVPPGDAKTMASAALELLNRPELAEAVAEAGRRRVEELCSIRARAELIEELYYRCIGESGESPSPNFIQRGINAVVGKLFLRRGLRWLDFPLESGD